ncbi:4Fe-4S binding protein [Clostridiaceae bacterium M8S5]|nr:4Fe-4S binding protein [Clostridiaceae bacterium M8S5]
MLESTGIATPAMIKEVFPSEERINRGPVAVIECFQRIPCNPCSTACKRNAIENFNDINDRPKINEDQCNGCGLCISRCPGLAIMIVDGSKSKKELIYKLPYELLPLPSEGEIVKGLDRAGEHICDASVIKVQNPKSFDRTPVIHVSVPREYMYKFRNIRVEG